MAEARRGARGARAGATASPPTAPSPAGFEIARIDLDPEVSLTQWVAPELGNSSYVLSLRESGTSVIIDPVRDVAGYASVLPSGRRGKVLALETHLHNDFVSGTRDLARVAQAEVGISAQAEVAFPRRPLRHQENLPVGEWALQVLATPGHTPEHVSYLLLDPEEHPRALFSGGALMVGGAARTDLFGPAMARPLARDLYRSIHEVLADLPASVLLLPTHGGGSFCASGASDRRSSTLGEERSSNPLVRVRSLDDFLSLILEQGPYPRYYARMRGINSGRTAIALRDFEAPRALPLDRFDRLRAEGAAVVDTRSAEETDEGRIPGSYAVGEDGPLSAWVGWLLPPDRPLLLLAHDEGQAREASRQLFRIGFDEVRGFLAGGLEVWRAGGRPLARTPFLDPLGMVQRLRSEEPVVVLDVREPHEWFDGHIPGSLNVPLGSLPQRLSELPRDVPLVVHCARGYRAAVATSILEQAGFTQLFRLRGGYPEWEVASTSPERAATVARPPRRARSTSGSPQG